MSGLYEPQSLGNCQECLARVGAMDPLPLCHACNHKAALRRIVELVDYDCYNEHGAVDMIDDVAEAALAGKPIPAWPGREAYLVDKRARRENAEAYERQTPARMAAAKAKLVAAADRVRAERAHKGEGE